MACASTPLCTSGVCTAPTCSAGEFNCAGAVLQSCNSTFNGWQDEETCASAPLCNETSGVCTAPQCATNDWRCTSGVLQQCKADRTGWDDRETCASQALCDEVQHECDDCVAPAFMCDMNVLFSCNGDGQFTMQQDCMTGMCNAMAGMCVGG
jgi:hypothetical protein